MSNDRFNAPKPKFFAPSKALIPTDGSFRSEKGAPPAKPLNDRAPLPALNLPDFGNQVRKETKARTKAEPKEIVIPQPMVKWGPEHICTDEEFIIKTRAHSIHDPGIKELFMANGGVEIADHYDTLANAFDALRRYKAAKLSGQLDHISEDTPMYERVTRFASHSISVFVPGLYADAEVRRERARENAARRNEEQVWINSNVSKVG